jgi:hypothetical protein
LPLSLPFVVRFQFWYTPSQTMDSIDKSTEITRQNGHKITPNTLWMSVYVLLDQVLMDLNPPTSGSRLKAGEVAQPVVPVFRDRNR